MSNSIEATMIVRRATDSYQGSKEVAVSLGNIDLGGGSSGIGVIDFIPDNTTEDTAA